MDLIINAKLTILNITAPFYGAFLMAIKGEFKWQLMKKL